MFTIILPRYSYSKSFPRDRFMELFPGSMITNTLELCQSETKITLTQDFITPDILNFLEVLITSWDTPAIKDDKDPLKPLLVKSGAYLGILVLSIIGDPEYTSYYRGLMCDVNLFTLEKNPERYRIFAYAVFHGFEPLIELCLDIGLDPRTDVGLCGHIGEANWILPHLCQRGKLSSVNRLLKCPELQSSLGTLPCIMYAVTGGHVHVIHRLLQDPRIDINLKGSLVAACVRKRLDIVQLLLSDKRCDPTYNECDAINVCIGRGYTDILQVLLNDSRVPPDAKFNRYPFMLTPETDSIIQSWIEGRVGIAS